MRLHFAIRAFLKFITQERKVMGNNPMVGATVAVAVSIEEAK